MTDFKRVVGRVLGGIGEAFEKADADLHRVVSAASEAVEDYTGNRFRLQLAVVDENIRGRLYSLDVSGQEGVTSVGRYLLRKNGYPMLFGQGPFGGFSRSAELSNESEIAEHLQHMIEDPDSTLTTYLAFRLRAGEDSD